MSYSHAFLMYMRFLNDTHELLPGLGNDDTHGAIWKLRPDGTYDEMAPGIAGQNCYGLGCGLTTYQIVPSPSGRFLAKSTIPASNGPAIFRANVCRRVRICVCTFAVVVCAFLSVCVIYVCERESFWLAIQMCIHLPHRLRSRSPQRATAR